MFLVTLMVSLTTNIYSNMTTRKEKTIFTFKYWTQTWEMTLIKIKTGLSNQLEKSFEQSVFLFSQI